MPLSLHERLLPCHRMRVVGPEDHGPMAHFDLCSASILCISATMPVLLSVQVHGMLFLQRDSFGCPWQPCSRESHKDPHVTSQSTSGQPTPASAALPPSIDALLCESPPGCKGGP